MKRNFCCAVTTAVILMLASLPVHAQRDAGPGRGDASSRVPRLVKYSGAVRANAGAARTGAAAATFAIYAEQEGGAALWQETQNVALDVDGRYSVLLGSASRDGMPAELFATGEPRWLGVRVNVAGDAEASIEQARVLLVSVPYALRAADAETLGGRPATDFILRDELAGWSGVAAGVMPGAADAPRAVGGSQGVVNATGAVSFIPRVTSINTPAAGDVTYGNSQIFDDGTNIRIGNAAVGTGLVNIELTTPLARNAFNSTLRLENTAPITGTVISAMNLTGADRGTASHESFQVARFTLLKNVISTGVATNFDSVFATTAFINANAPYTVVGWRAEFPRVATGMTLGTYYGLFLEAPLGGGGTVTNAFALVTAPGSGNVGIGTLTPTRLLDVAGDARVSGAFYADSFFDVFTSIEVGLPTTCSSGQTVKFSGTAWGCAADADSGGTITGVTAGTGLTGGGASGAVTLSADTAFLQRRVTGMCATGSSISAIASDGTVTCEPDDVGTGTVTSVAAGAGLTGGPITTSGALAVDTSLIQSRVTGTCAAGSSVRTVNQDGSVVCEADDNSGGTVTSVASGDGLTGGPISLSGTLAVDSSVARRNAANSFAGSQTVTGDVSASGTLFGTASVLNATAPGTIFSGQLSGVDTLVLRNDALILRPRSMLPPEDSIPIEIVALNLVSINPVEQGYQWQTRTGNPDSFLSLNYRSGPGPASSTGLAFSSTGRLLYGGVDSILPPGCSNGDTTTFSFSTQMWICSPAGGTGTVTQINTGAGLTGGPISTTGTVSVATGGVTNAMLQNSSLMVNTGTGLSGGGSVSLGGTLTLANTGVLGVTAADASISVGGTASAPTVMLNTGNANAWSAGQTFNGGGIYNGGTLTLNNSMLSASGGTQTMVFNPGGRRFLLDSGGPDPLRYDYDGLNRRIRHESLGVNPSTFTFDGANTAVTYDAPGFLVSWGVDGPTRRVTAATGGTNPTTYMYDGLSRLVRLTSVTDDAEFELNAATRTFASRAQAATAVLSRSSPRLTMINSVFNSGTMAPDSHEIALLLAAVGHNTASTSGRLDVLFDNVAVTSMNSDGTWNFAPGQTFPGTGTVTSVTGGAGLTGGTITASGTLAVDTTTVQSRVTGTCPTGSSISAVNGNGTVLCEVDDNSGGTVTSVASGDGLTGGPISSAGTLAVDATVARRNAANTFTSTQTVTGDVNASGALFGASSVLDNSAPGNIFVARFGGSDRVWVRHDSVALRPFGMTAPQDSIPIEIVALSLVSASPIEQRYQWQTLAGDPNAALSLNYGSGAGATPTGLTFSSTGRLLYSGVDSILPPGCSNGNTATFSSGTQMWICSPGGSGTVTQINTGAGLTGGPIIGTGTVSVDAAAGFAWTGTHTWSGGGAAASLSGTATTFSGPHTVSLDNGSRLDTLAGSVVRHLAGSTVQSLGAIVTFDALSVETHDNAPSFFAPTSSPFFVTSTTRVDNLNADLLDGNDSAFFTNASNMTSGTLPSGRLSGTYGGIVTFGNFTGTGSFNGTHSGDGSALTGVTATTLAAGTHAGVYSFNNASNSFSGSGAGLTNVNAASLSGISLSSFARRDAANTFTSTNTYNGSTLFEHATGGTPFTARQAATQTLDLVRAEDNTSVPFFRVSFDGNVFIHSNTFLPATGVADSSLSFGSSAINLTSSVFDSDLPGPVDDTWAVFSMGFLNDVISPSSQLAFQDGTGTPVVFFRPGGSIQANELLDPAGTRISLPGFCASANQVATWSGTDWVCATPSGTGTVTSVAAGDTSITITGNPLINPSVAVNTSVIQARVSGTCAAGSSIRVIDAAGTVTCEPDDDTTYTAGTGLNLTGTTFSNTGVLSFNGRTGAVLPASADYSYAQISGTLPNAALSGTYGTAVTLSNAGNSFAGDGSALTALNANNLGSGTVPSARLSGAYSSALTLSNAANSFTAAANGLQVGATQLATANNNVGVGVVPVAGANRLQVTGNMSVSASISTNSLAATGNISTNTNSLILAAISAINTGAGGGISGQVSAGNFAVRAANSTASESYRSENTGGGRIFAGYGNGGIVAGAVFFVENSGAVTAASMNTLTNCASSADPAVCGSASSGSVSIAAADTDVVVNTTAVTANSQIHVTEDSTLSTRLGVTCNTTFGRTYQVTARTAGASFVITASVGPAVNPACLSYTIVN